MSTQRLSSMDLSLSVCECVFVWKTGAYAIEEYTQRSSDKELDEVKSSFNACLFVTYSKRYRRRPWCHHRHLKNSVDWIHVFFVFSKIFNICTVIAVVLNEYFLIYLSAEQRRCLALESSTMTMTLLFSFHKSMLSKDKFRRKLLWTHHVLCFKFNHEKKTRVNIDFEGSTTSVCMCPSLAHSLRFFFSFLW